MTFCFVSFLPLCFSNSVVSARSVFLSFLLLVLFVFLRSLFLSLSHSFCFLRCRLSWISNYSVPLYFSTIVVIFGYALQALNILQAIHVISAGVVFLHIVFEPGPFILNPQSPVGTSQPLFSSIIFLYVSFFL